MKTVGLIGGISWYSTAEYYRYFNEITAERLGGYHSLKCLIYSVDFAEIKALQAESRWDLLSDMMTGIAQRLEKAGAECLLIGANTMNKVADEVQAQIGIPLLHIADVTAEAIKKQGLRRVALTGTRYTMEHDFFRERLARHGLEALIPDAEGRDYIHAAIYNELSRGIFRAETRDKFLEIIAGLTEQGAEGAILGCTEIPLLIKQEHCPIPVFDTTYLHAQAAVDFALS